MIILKAFEISSVTIRVHPWLKGSVFEFNSKDNDHRNKKKSRLLYPLFHSYYPKRILTFFLNGNTFFSITIEEACKMKITTKGQVTIPREVREKLGLLPHSEVEFIVEGNTVLLKKVESSESRGKRVVEGLRGRATVRMTTDEIMALTRGED